MRRPCLFPELPAIESMFRDRDSRGCNCRQTAGFDEPKRTRIPRFVHRVIDIFHDGLGNRIVSRSQRLVAEQISQFCCDLVYTSNSCKIAQLTTESANKMCKVR